MNPLKSRRQYRRSETTDRVPEREPGWRVRVGPRRRADPAQVYAAGGAAALSDLARLLAERARWRFIACGSGQADCGTNDGGGRSSSGSGCGIAYGEVSDCGHFLRFAFAGRVSVCLPRRSRGQGPGDLHCRSDEADERDRIRRCRRDCEVLLYPTASPSSLGSPCFLSAGIERQAEG
jgi:hypothetical protein